MKLPCKVSDPIAKKTTTTHFLSGEWVKSAGSGWPASYAVEKGERSVSGSHYYSDII